MANATISYGSKLGLINNAAIGEIYYDSFRPFLRGVDALVQASVISTLSSPPSSPNDGDAYLVTAPTGLWAGHTNHIAVYSTQITQAGGDTLLPGWDYYIPKAGWLIFVVADAGYLNFDGSAWSALIPTATTSNLGLVQPDGTTITISSGIISSIGGGGGAANYTQLPTTLASPNGSTTYSLGFTPTTPAASFYFVNGIKRVYGTYYTISGSTLTILDANPPNVANGDTGHEIYVS